MALTRVTNSGNYSFAETNTLDTVAQLSIQSGDFIAVKVSGHNASGSLPSLTIGIVGSSDTATLDSWVQYSTNTDLLLRRGYIIATGSSTAYIRATAGNNLNVFDFCVIQYRPDSGETITVYDGSGAYGTTALIQSPTLSASGDDIVYFGSGWNNSGPALNTEQIGGVTADSYVRYGRGGMWCRAFSSGQSDLRATAAFSDNDAWLADVFAISAAAPAPSGHPLAYDGNGSTHGTAPAGGTYNQGDSITVAARPAHLVAWNYVFSTWNTASNGSGTSYAPGATLTMPDAAVTLYAQWTTYAGGAKIIRHGSHDPSTLSNAQVLAAAQVDTYCENASVGEDIFGNSITDSSAGVDHGGTDPCGLALLYSSNSRYSMSRDYNAYGCDASWFSTHSGLQNNFRDNPAYATKISGFASNLATMASSISAAFVKFCFIDGPSDPDAEYDSIMSAYATWTSTYPAVKIVLWTMPIESSANTDHNPANRQHYNAMIRQGAIDAGAYLFDIADLESDGGSIVSGGRECLSDSYTVDGGHLNSTAKIKVAGAWWRMASLLAPSTGSATMAVSIATKKTTMSAAMAVTPHAPGTVSMAVSIASKKTTMHANVRVGTYINPDIIIPVTFTVMPSIDTSFHVDLDG